jgi:transcription elongation factor Elf1
MSEGEEMLVCRLCGARFPEEMLTREKEFEHLVCGHFDLVMALAESLWEFETVLAKKDERAQVITK